MGHRHDRHSDCDHDHSHSGGWRGFFEHLRGHSHNTTPNSWHKAVKILLVMLLNGLLAYWQIYTLAQEANSAAIFVDGIHNAGDVVSTAVPLAALGIAVMAALRGRANDSIIPTALAFANYLVLALFMVSAVLFAVWRLAVDPVESSGDIMSKAGIVSLVVNATSVVLLYEKGGEDKTMSSALMHQLSDMLSSMGVLAGAVIVSATGWRSVDPIVTIAISVFILWVISKDTRETGLAVLERLQNRSAGQPV